MRGPEQEEALVRILLRLTEDMYEAGILDADLYSRLYRMQEGDLTAVLAPAIMDARG